MLRTFLPALLLAASTLSALAASPEEAARIKASLEAYVGNEPGVVKVEPQGEAYAITLDALPYFNKYASAEFKAYADPLALLAEPMGNGQWKVSGKGPWGIQISAPEKMEMSARAANQDWSGIFDEALGGFASSTGTFSGLSFSQKARDPSVNATVNISYAIQALTTSSNATGDGNGGADSTSKMEMTGISMATSAEGADGAPSAELAAMNYTASAGKFTYDTSAKGLRLRALMDLVAWFVARPSKDAIIRDQVQLKEKLASALPFFQSVSSKAAYDGLNVVTAFGPIAVPSATIDADMNGIVKDGMLREKFAFSGFTIPPGLVPPWTQELVPNNFSLDFSLSGFDLESPAKTVLAQLDLSKDPPVPAGMEQLLLPALVPTNAVNISFAASEISAPAYSVTYDGSLVASLAGFPTGKFNVKFKGIDAVMAKVQAQAADPAAQQMMAGLIAAKGMGKAEPDGTLSYAIDIQPMAQVFVNGVNVTAMAGGQPPAQ